MSDLKILVRAVRTAHSRGLLSFFFLINIIHSLLLHWSSAGIAASRCFNVDDFEQRKIEIKAAKEEQTKSQLTQAVDSIYEKVAEILPLAQVPNNVLPLAVIGERKKHVLSGGETREARIIRRGNARSTYTNCRRVLPEHSSEGDNVRV